MECRHIRTDRHGTIPRIGAPSHPRARRGRTWRVLALAALQIVSACSADGASATGDAAVAESGWRAWSAGDRDAFYRLVADDAQWFGLPVTTESGQANMDFSWAMNTTMDARFSEYECAETGETDAATGGSLVECAGLFTDKRFEAFEADPTLVTGRYAVLDDHLVNFISFDPGPIPEWNEFLDRYLAANHGAELSASCDGPDATGEGCANAVISHLGEATEAWAAANG